MSFDTDTIVAQATPPGRGGVGIVRVSGPLAQHVAQEILGKLPKPRMADSVHFLILTALNSIKVLLYSLIIRTRLLVKMF